MGKSRVSVRTNARNCAMGSCAVRLAFYKGEGDWVDKVVRWWTKSQYSHVEVVVGDTWISSSPRDGGVRSMRMESYNAKHWDTIDYPGVSTIDVFDLFRRTKGNDYDFIGILFSQVLPTGLHSSTKWYCSEWAAELKYDKTNLSPQELYELVSKV